MKFLTVLEAAEVLGVNRKIVYQLIEKENLPAYRISERNIRINEDELIKWIKKREI